MTKDELFEIIKNGENSGIEFKEDTVDNVKFAKEIVAFANMYGGRILLGVGDSGEVKGITRDKLEEWVMTACRDKIRPEIIPFYEIVRDVELGKDIAVVQVAQGLEVHSLWHNNHKTYNIRVGSQSREASTEELARLFQQRGAFRLEIRGVSGAKLQDLDMRRLVDYYERVRGQEIPKEDDLESWTRLLLNTEFMVEEGGISLITVATLLLFSPKPNRFLPQAGIEAVCYPGKEKDYAAKERMTIRGPITPLYSKHGIVELGLVESALAFIKRNIMVTATLDNGKRKDRWEFPEDAVREILVNAIAHRDYLLSATDIELSIYEDRLEVISPGKLPNGITPTRMKTGCRATRNQLIKDVMRDYKYVESSGMGIPRKVVKGMMEHNGKAPDLIEDGERFIVRLWK